MRNTRSNTQAIRSDAEERLRSNYREQQVVLDSASVGIAMVKHRKIQRCNQRFAEIFGYPDASSVLGINSTLLYPDEATFTALGKAAYPVMATGQAYKTEIQILQRGGQLRWVNLTGKSINVAELEEGSIWIVDDISDEKAAQARLQAVLFEQSLILENAMVGIAFLRDRKVTQCNRSFEALFGYERGELNGSSSRQWYLTEQDWLDGGARCYAPFAAGEAFQGEMLLCRKDGSPITCEVRAKAIDPSNPIGGSIWITMDITARKNAELELIQARENLEKLVDLRTTELKNTVKELEVKAEQQRSSERHIKQLAHFDALTGLPNRLLLNERCNHNLSLARRQQHQVALMFLDLDHFKIINDSLGHRVGDNVLVALAERLKSVMREQDMVARLGGDEFILLLPDTEAAGAARVAERVLQLAQQPFLIEHHELSVTPSIGIAMFPKDGADLDTLSKCADAAMYRAKADGRNGYRFFTDEIQAKSDRSLVLGNALHRALERHQFELHYQPQISLETGKTVGAEALLRWHHPELGSVLPSEFIPLVENGGLIVPIGEWVIDTAITQLANWMRRGMAPITLSVNLSSVQFRQSNLPQLVADKLSQAGVPASMFGLELTESVAMTNPQAAMAIMDDFHARGIRMSIDDFGTGYSSLSYLKRFQIDKLKIDQSFVRDIEHDPEDKAIVHAIISMAASLGLETLAEGVETQGQLDFLRTNGCTQAQGYFFSKPVPAAQFEAFVRGSTM